MSSHDVRNLKVCNMCGNIGDKTRMVGNGRWRYHGKCWFGRFGTVESGIKELGPGNLQRLSLDDIGPEIMAEVLKHIGSTSAASGHE